MKVQNVALGCLLASSALATIDPEDGGAFDKIVAPKESSTKSSSKVEHPAYTPIEKPPNAVMFEQFDEGAEERWLPSHGKKDDEFSFVGKWAFEEPTVYPGFTGDRGLVVKSPAAHHGISAKLDKPLDNTGKTLVVQYEVKLQKGLECGGAYMKLLSENEALHAEEFSNQSPYQIMFGPDKCGTTNKVHFIVRRKDPKTGEYEEKHLAVPPAARLTKLSNLYTLIINPDNSFEIRINGETVRAGNLLDSLLFRPAFNPPEEIEDPHDEKPEDWIDDEYMPDPEQATKPEDWDEDAPLQIADPEASKPEDWDEESPETIPDPDAEKPVDWDDEEDGEWVAPEVPNPECLDHGCGPWEAPLVRNPAYKGKWIQPKIKNPDYKGEWAPRKIPNPDFYSDDKASDLEPIGAIGFELWTMQNDILFDNIYLGHSIEEAEQVGNATYVAKYKIEAAEEEAVAPKPKEKKRYESALEYLKDDPIGYFVEVSRLFILNFSHNPTNAVKNQPGVAIVFGTTFVSLCAIAFGILNVILYGIKTALFGKKKAGKKAEKSADKPAAAASSSAQSSATTATKRKE